MHNVCTGLGGRVTSQAFGRGERTPPPDAQDRRFETTRLHRWTSRERAEPNQIITTGHMTRVDHKAQPSSLEMYLTIAS